MDRMSNNGSTLKGIVYEPKSQFLMEISAILRTDGGEKLDGL
jgi:hypothetical protein